MTPPALTEALGVGRSTVYRWIRNGWLTSSGVDGAERTVYFLADARGVKASARIARR